MYIVFGILIFFAVSLVLGKWPFGLTAMTCCVLLVLTGVYNLPQAFSGFTNKILIMMAPMYVLCYAFGRTSVMAMLRGKMALLQDKRGLLLMLGVLGMLILFAQFFPSAVTLTLIIVFVQSLSDTGDITPSRLLIPLAGLAGMWGCALPFGMGLTNAASTNAYYEALTTDPSQLLTVFEPFKFLIIPCLLTTIWTLVGFKLLPKGGSVDTSKLRKVQEQEKLSKRDETIIYIAFGLVVLALFFSNQIGNIVYIAPAIGVLVLAFSKALTIREVVENLACDPIFMVAGALAISNAMADTGAGEAIGNFILRLLGSNPSPLMGVFVFGLTGLIMTSVMSNFGAFAILTPLAASTALAAGWDPKALVMAVNQMTICAIILPSASPAAAIAHATAGCKIKDSLIFTIPFGIIALIGCMISALLFFPA